MTDPAAGPSPAPPILAIVGPTAAGKSAFALEVAARFGGEIVSCDSMAVYRGLDIGTDKPSAEARALVRHHLLDVADPGTTFSAGAFREMALAAMADIASRGRLCVIVGGTGLYYRALTQGLIRAPGRQEEIRERLKARLARTGPERLHRLLSRLDPRTAARLGRRDALRIIRAIEVYIATGTPLSEWIARAPFGAGGLRGAPTIGLTAPREVLYARIDSRVDAMMSAGLLAEVRGLHAAGMLAGPVRKAIGYGELAHHLEGLISLEGAVARIKLRSRHLAKRQLAWFRREKGISWYRLDKEAWKNESMEFIERWYEKGRSEQRDQHSEPNPQLRPQGSGPHHHFPGER